MLLLTKTEHVVNVAHPISLLNAGARAALAGRRTSSLDWLSPTARSKRARTEPCGGPGPGFVRRPDCNGRSVSLVSSPALIPIGRLAMPVFDASALNDNDEA